MTEAGDWDLDLSAPTEYGVRKDLLLKTQDIILRHAMPAIRLAIEEVTNFMFEPESDDEEIHDHLRELATETVIDELVRLLTRDLVPVSKRYMVNDVDGIGIDTLIACHSELAPENIRAWYAHALRLPPETYQQLIKMLPDHMDM